MHTGTDAIWTSGPYATLQDAFLSTEPRDGQLEAARIHGTQPVNLDEVEDVADFMDTTVDFLELEPGSFFN